MQWLCYPQYNITPVWGPCIIFKCQIVYQAGTWRHPVNVVSHDRKSHNSNPLLIELKFKTICELISLVTALAVCAGDCPLCVSVQRKRGIPCIQGQRGVFCTVPASTIMSVSQPQHQQGRIGSFSSQFVNSLSIIGKFFALIC